MRMGRKEEVFRPALYGKNVPIVILDQKWHLMFAETGKPEEIVSLEQELNELLKRQGKLNSRSKEMHKIKTKLMDEIVSLMPQDGSNPDKALQKKLDENKRLINECNDKLAAESEELLDIPKEIDRVNYELMLLTMEYCYEQIKENTKEIDEISKWINQVRIDLKKNVVKKQKKEIYNKTMYAYMHDIFGADVIELFDMQYNPEQSKKQRSVPQNEIKGD